MLRQLLILFLAVICLTAQVEASQGAASSPPTLTTIGIASSRADSLLLMQDTVSLSFTANAELPAPSVWFYIGGREFAASALETVTAGTQWIARCKVPYMEDPVPDEVGFLIQFYLPGGDRLRFLETTDGSKVIFDPVGPQISVLPIEVLFVNAGEPFTLTSYGESLFPVTYSWYRNEDLLADESSPTLSRPAAQEDDSGEYLIIARSVSGQASDSARVRVVGGPPRFLRQPASELVPAGADVALSVVAAGSAPLSYQWRKGGKDIPGATQPSYLLPLISSAEGGGYSVVVKNSLGSITSDIAEVKVTAAGSDGHPRILLHPTSQLVFAGNPATFSAVTSSLTSPLHEWRKNGTKISGTTNANTRTLPAVRLTDAGAYTLLLKNAVGTVLSTAARLGVVEFPPTSDLVVSQGETATFKVNASGSGLHFRWRKNGVFLHDQVISASRSLQGSRTATLIIKDANTSDRGSYECVITLEGEELVTYPRHLGVALQPPLFTAAAGYTMPQGMVGRPYQEASPPITPGEDHLPSLWTATGLPAGLKVHPLDGTIQGRPTQASPSGRPFQFTLKASNKLGSSSLQVRLEVLPAPKALVGTYVGLIGRSSLNHELGGRITFTTTATGAFSGTLTLGSKSHAIRGQLDVWDPQAALSGFVIPGTSLRLDLIVDNLTTGSWTGTLDDPGQGIQASINGGRNQSLKAVPYPPGRYNVWLKPSPSQVGDAVYPQGSGYLTLKISSTGALTWSGRLADGTAITAGGQITSELRVPLQILLYGSQGSLQGWCDVMENGGLEGYLNWFKANLGPKSTSRSYKTGFPGHDLLAQGGLFLELPPPILGTPGGREIAFTQGGLGVRIFQFFMVNPNFSLRFPYPPPLKFTTFDPKTGLFSGTLNHQGRKALFNGLMRGDGNGFGHFLLQEAPDEPGETSSNTPLQSGMVELKVDRTFYF